MSRSVADTRSEVCWATVTNDGRFAYVTNFGDGTISSYEIAEDGSLELRDAVAGSTRLGEKGIRDEAITRDGRHLYAIDADAQRVFGWTIGSDGELVAGRSVRGRPRDRRRARRELTGRGEAGRMRLEPLYRARFTTPERWSVELRGPHGTEAQSLLFAEGRCEGRVAARLRAANFPRRRTDDTLTPDFRGVLETDDGATILFTWQGTAAPRPTAFVSSSER